MRRPAANICPNCRRLQAEVDSLRAQLKDLQAVVAGLQQQLAAARKDSSTSSKPPSSDIVKPPKAPPAAQQTARQTPQGYDICDVRGKICF
jgi:transposase